MININDSDILHAVQQGKIEAQQAIEFLGMKNDLKKCWENPIMANENVDTILDMTDDDDIDNVKDNDEVPLPDDDSTLEEMYLEDNFSTLQADVQKLKEENVIDENLTCKIMKKNQSKLEKIKLHSLPLYQCTSDIENTTPPYSFLKIMHNQKDIRKSTIVWLFTEGYPVIVFFGLELFNHSPATKVYSRLILCHPTIQKIGQIKKTK